MKVIHADKREGLIRARLIGYHAATSPMLVFFDSHIECFPGMSRCSGDGEAETGGQGWGGGVVVYGR